MLTKKAWIFYEMRMLNSIESYCAWKYMKIITSPKLKLSKLMWWHLKFFDFITLFILFWIILFKYHEDSKVIKFLFLQYYLRRNHIPKRKSVSYRTLDKWKIIFSKWHLLDSRNKLTRPIRWAFKFTRNADLLLLISMSDNWVTVIRKRDRSCWIK